MPKITHTAIGAGSKKPGDTRAFLKWDRSAGPDPTLRRKAG